ncbi:MAG TPA: nucleoside hydrolase [Bacteroidales bacterium]|nr:nucleoside hydrolase [Bacteroidales bacterium]HPJ60484.1 nucleoside hydrolase [Bacteroidales bacterium]HPR13276.1 nucleoside hydrolase [Bacteroidales bacterium]HRW84933.1 nucleoside hydrolase [Bacteroidales bacterium]
MKTKFFLLSGLLFLLFQCAYAQKFPKIDESVRIKRLEPPKDRVRAVLDTDTYNEIDDQFALSYAVLSKEKIDLEAVYAAPYFNSRSTSPADGMEKSYQEILRLLKFLGKSPDGFAFRGSDRYLEDVSKPVRSDAALDLIKKAKNSSPGNPLYVITVGCITNVASAILIDPSIIEDIVVVWLGGNSPEWPDQREFNLRQDVKAARVVLNSGVPLVIMPCQPVVARFHTTIPEMTQYLKGKSPLADYLLKTTIDYSGGRDYWSKVIWDVTAVAWLVNPSWMPTNIVHSPVLTDQVTYSTDMSRHFIRMATSVNRDALFRDLFVKISNAR